MSASTRVGNSIGTSGDRTATVAAKAAAETAQAAALASETVATAAKTDAVSASNRAVQERIAAAAAAVEAGTYSAAMIAAGAKPWTAREAANDAVASGAAYAVGDEDKQGIGFYTNTGASFDVTSLFAHISGTGQVTNVQGRVTTLEARSEGIVRFLSTDPVPPEAVKGDGTYDVIPQVLPSGKRVTRSVEMADLSGIEALDIGPNRLTSGNGIAAVVVQDLIEQREDGTYKIGPDNEFGVRDTGGDVFLIRGNGLADVEIGFEHDFAADLAYRYGAHKGPGYIGWYAAASLGAPAYLRRMSTVSGIRTQLAGFDSIIDVQWLAQSNTVGAESATIGDWENTLPDQILALDGDQVWPGHVRLLGHGQGPTHLGEILEPHYLNKLVPALEMVTDGAGRTQCWDTGYEIALQNPTSYVAVGTHGIGSASAGNVGWGRQPTKNLLLARKRTWEICLLLGLEYIPITCWAPHEASAATLYQDEIDLRTDFQTRESAWMSILTGGVVTNVPMATFMMSNVTYNDFTSTQIGLAARYLADTYPTKHLAPSPTYLFTTLPSGAHYTGDGAGAGRAGAYAGLDIAGFLAGRDVRPFGTTACTLVAGNLEMPLRTSYGAGAVSLTSGIVTSTPTQYGVLVRDASDVDIPGTVTLIDGGTKLRFTPSSPFASGLKKIGIAFWGTAGAQGGPNIAGAIRSSINDGRTHQDINGVAMARHIAPAYYEVTVP